MVRLKISSIILLVILLLGGVVYFASSTEVNAYVSVKGYYRKDGTYVRPYVRSNPNGLKSDNYSWTPSQGVYNPTYGTRGSYWDTPTYITDPNYYEGQALYQSGGYSAGSSNSIPPSGAVLNTNSNANLFQGMSGAQVTQLQSILATDASLYPEKIVSGYFGSLTEAAVRRFQKKYGLAQTGVFDSNTRSVFSTVYSEVNVTYSNNTQSNTSQQSNASSLPANAYWSTQTTWKCYSGYEAVSDKCVALNLPANAYWSTQTTWRCYSGYQAVGDSCQKLFLPANAYWSTQTTWKCYSGYKEVGNECVALYLPANAYWSTQTTWKCYSGYEAVGNECQKLYLPPNAYWSTQTTWRCYNGYQTIGNSCVAI